MKAPIIKDWTAKEKLQFKVGDKITNCNGVWRIDQINYNKVDHEVEKATCLKYQNRVDPPNWEGMLTLKYFSKVYDKENRIEVRW